jgi:hypothetical protein
VILVLRKISGRGAAVKGFFPQTQFFAEIVAIQHRITTSTYGSVEPQ